MVGRNLASEDITWNITILGKTSARCQLRGEYPAISAVTGLEVATLREGGRAISVGQISNRLYHSSKDIS
jgi:hypothetical protein